MKVSNNILEAYKSLKTLDNKAFINDCDYNGVNYWPLVRYHFLSKFLNAERYNSKLQSSNSLKRSFKKKLFNYKVKKAYRKELSKLNNAEVLFISNLTSYKTNSDGVYYNKNTDPWNHYLNHLGKHSVSIELSNWNEDYNNYNFFGRTQIFNSDYFFMQDSVKNNKDFLQIQKRFNTVFNKHGADINSSLFAKHVVNIRNYTNLYRDILIKVKPKIIFTVCWYSVDKMALCNAAHSLKIKIVDLQHGKQGKYHPMYYGWKNDFSNKNLIPDELYLWGKYSYDLINEESNLKNKFIPTITGNPWLLNYDLFLSQKEIDLYEKFKSKRQTRNVIIALQPVEINYQLHIIKNIILSNQDCNFLVRFHPGNKNHEEWYNLLGKYENVDFDYANSLPLNLLFRESEVCLSCWSTVLLEANYADVLPVCIHENGKNIFKENILNCEMYFSTDIEEIKSFIRNSNKYLKSMKKNNLFSEFKYDVAKI